MKRISTCGGVLVSVLTCSGLVAAEPNVQGLTLGVERVFGLTSVTATDENDAVTNTSSETGFSLGNAGTARALYTIPRVHVDYVLPMGLSFGGALGFRVASYSYETDPAVGPTLSNDGSGSAFLFAPRVGYLLGFNDQFGIWPRLGFSYVNVSSDGDDDTNADDTSLSYGAFTLEAPFVFTPHKAFGFVATPSLDLGVAGSREVGNNEYDGDLSLTEFGITLGLFVAF